MGDGAEKLQRQLEAAQQALAEAEVRYAQREAEHQATTRELVEARKKIEQAHQEWMAALDVMEDPIFLHDKDFRILRCNRAYQQCVGIPFGQIIGQPYYNVFPKTHTPLRHCLQTMDKNMQGAEDEVIVGETIYRSRSSSINDNQGNYLYAIHILQDITDRKLAEDNLRGSKDLLRSIVENAPIRVFWKDTDLCYLGCNTLFAKDAGHSRPDEVTGKTDFDMAWKDQAELYRADDKAVMDSGNAKLDYEEPQTKDDGTTVWVRTSKVPLRDQGNRIIGMLGIYQDVTERKVAADKLRENEAFIKAVLDNLPVGIAVNSIDPAVTFSYMNDSFPKLYRTTREKLNEPDTFWEAVYEDPEFRQQIRQRVLDDCTSGDVERMHWEDIPVARKGEETFYISAMDIPLPGKSLMISMVWDVTKRKYAEQVLVEEKTFSDTLIKNLPDLFYMLDQQGNFLRWSDHTAELLNLTAEEMAKTNALAFVHEEDREYITKKIQEVFETGSTKAEGRIVAHRGIRHYAFSASRIETRFGLHLLGVGIDITERKLAEDRLRESEARLQTIFEGALDGILLADPATRDFSSGNSAICRMLGFTLEEFIQLNVSDIHPPEDMSYIIEQFEKQAIGKTRVAPDIPVKRKDGSVFYADISSSPVSFNGKNYILEIFHDITERKQHEDEIQKVNRALSLLSECNTLLVHATNEPEILADICKLAVETGGYLMAWVGFAEHDENRTVRPVAESGYEEGYLDNAKISWADTELGLGPTGTAIRTVQTVINQDVQTNPSLAPWREAALKRGYQASIALPLVSDTQVLGALTIYAVEPDAFTKEEVYLLEELANDLAYGIVTLRTRKEHEQHTLILRQSLEQSIQTIADTVEARDPYTAGHQRRVAGLAKAIAQEMDLPEDQVNGINLAAIIHDLGKIHIPAEILAKPGKLSPIEFELIKTHPQEGYNILKNVRFPWPIAEIILQHHERLDGSGYPQGLKGEQIILEARILAVADVVEAITSHRPYRPGFGIEAALEEIERSRGVRYDTEVADACLRLFRERGYKLPD